MTLQASPQAWCKSCGKSFLRFRTMQAVCSPACAHRAVMATKKAEKEQTRARRLAVKPRSKWLAEAQQAFNAYIRARDEALPCISCGRHHAGSHDAGHYMTIGARPELRFHEQNVHRQCVPCNRHLHGNLILYRAGLIKRIGLAAVEKLEGPPPADALQRGRPANHQAHLPRQGAGTPEGSSMKTIATLILLALCASLLSACSGDGANPFDKPDETTQPVNCAASAACQ